MIVSRRKHRVNLACVESGRFPPGQLGKSETKVSNAMNMISKLGARALAVGMTITAAGCAKSGASTHTAGGATAGAPAAHSAASIPSSHQNAEEKMPRVKVEEAKKLVAEGKAIFIDVRIGDAYKTSHIQGALEVPLNKLEAGDFKDLPKDKLIIAYCA
jgi:Rhodanese-like domain